MATTMSSTPAKFTFDLDMGMSPERRRAMSDASMAELLATARQQGYDEGFKAGERSTASAGAKSLSAAAQAIAARGAEMLAAVDDARQETLREAVDLAASVGRKLASHLLAQEPKAEIAALLADCMSTLDAVPHLVIRCHPDIADGVREIATQQMATSSFAGRLIVMGDPDQQVGDCRIEWVDGGLVRNFDAIDTEINNRIAAFVAARGAARRKGHEQ